MKYLFLVCILIGWQGSLLAKVGPIDSLKNELRQSSAHPSEVQLLLAKEYLKQHHFNHSSLDSVVYYLNLVSSSDLDPAGEIYPQTLLLKAELLKIKRDYSGSNQLLDKAIEKFESLKDPYHICKARYNKAHNYYKVGIYQEAVPLFEELLMTETVRSDTVFLASTYSSFAGVLLNLKQHDRSKKMVLEAIQLISGTDSIRTGGLFYNLGLTYLTDKAYDSAYFYFDKSLTYWTPKDYYHGIGLVYGSIARLHTLTKNYDRAIDYLLKSKKQFDQSTSPPLIQEWHLQMAKNYLLLNNVPRADSYLSYVDTLPEAQRSLSVNRTLDYLKALKYEQLGQYKLAFTFQKAYELKNDSLLKQEALDKAQKANERLEFIEQNRLREMEEWSIQSIKDKQRLESKRFQTIFFALLALVLFSLSVFLYLLYKRKQKEIQLIDRLEKSTSTNQHLKQEIENRQRKLSSYTLREIEKNQKLEQISAGLKTMKDNTSDRSTLAEITKVSDQIKKLQNTDQHWEEFKLYFEEVHSGFFDALRQKHTNLTSRDMRLAAFIRLNLSTKEIANLINSTSKSVEVARYRLRKKLDLDSKTNLNQYLSTFS